MCLAVALRTRSSNNTHLGPSPCGGVDEREPPTDWFPPGCLGKEMPAEAAALFFKLGFDGP